VPLTRRTALRKAVGRTEHAPLHRTRRDQSRCAHAHCHNRVGRYRQDGRRGRGLQLDQALDGKFDGHSAPPVARHTSTFRCAGRMRPPRPGPATTGNARLQGSTSRPPAPTSSGRAPGGMTPAATRSSSWWTDKPAVYIEDATYQTWHWVKGPRLTLSAGQHTIRIQNREDGARLDQFMLINSTRYVPTGSRRRTAAVHRQVADTRAKLGREPDDDTDADMSAHGAPNQWLAARARHHERGGCLSPAAQIEPDDARGARGSPLRASRQASR
jgi:hypothetical protein